jgi:putative DNA primase/helicase
MGWIKTGYPQDIKGEKILQTGGLGIATGRGSGVIVLDVDGEEGKATLQALMEKHGALPNTPMQKTPGGGYHIFFKAWGPCKNRTGMLDKEGLDVRGDGGQVVAAPSLHPNGGSYAWIEGGGSGDLEIAECPAWLKAIIEGEKPQERIASPVEETIPEGARDATLTSMAGTMRKRGMTAAAIEAALSETNRAQCQPPLPDDQVRKIVRSTGSKPPGTNVAQGKTQAQENHRIPVAELFSVVEDDPNPIELIAGLWPGF